MESQDIDHRNWTEAVEDLVHEGEIDKAITLLETTVSKLEDEKQNKSHELSTALFDLSKLYTLKGLSLKADATSSRALLIQEQSKLHKGKSKNGKDLACEDVSEDHDSRNETSACCGIAEDDWEAIADRAPDELLSPQSLPKISKLSLEASKVQSSKRRGRGIFSYKSQGLYSDQQSNVPIYDNSEDNSVGQPSQENTQINNSKYGTRHVLVLADFPPSTKTMDLEKLLEDSRDSGVVIRWVNDTVALAVFRSPALALEARNSIKCSFTVRILDENDEILSLIAQKDLEPPRPRPKTSARTAQRLIAQSMGIKLPSSFGSRELRKQEEARRNRIVSRQHLRDNAWGDDQS